MSIKLWTVYRLRRADQLWPFVHDVRLKATANVVQVLTDLYLEHMNCVDPNSEQYKKHLNQERSESDPKRADYFARLYVVRDGFSKLYQESSTSLRRSFYDFDVSLSFRQYKGAIIAIPYCDSAMRNVFDFLQSDKRVRDYHYQNQTDKPKTISDRVWAERRRFYHGIEREDQWRDLLVLDICKWSMWYLLDPWLDLAKQKSVNKPE